MLISGLKPYTFVTLLLKACTFWGCAATTHSTFNTPMAAPSVPENPRVFVTYHRRTLTLDRTITVEYRWSTPAEPNGDITQYKVFYSRSPTGPWTKVILSGRRHKYEITRAHTNTHYYFKVRACTPAGCGQETGIVEANTAEEKPVPQLLAAVNNTIRMFYPDQGTSRRIASGTYTSLTFITLITEDAAYYWLDHQNRIIKQGFGQNQTENEVLLELRGRGLSLTIDWIGRSLVWLEQTDEDKTQLMIYYLDQQLPPTQILTRDNPVGQVHIDPYHSMIYWTETQEDIGFLMKCGLDGSNVSPVLRRSNKTSGRRRRNVHSCTCPADMSITPVFTVDHSMVIQGHTEVYVVDKNTGSVWTSDLNACHCRNVIEGQNHRAGVLPPDYMTVDRGRLYWSSQTDQAVYSVDKHSGLGLRTEVVGDVDSMVAFGYNLQPPPNPACILLGNYTNTATFVLETNTSMTLTIQPWLWGPECVGLSQPPAHYVVHYRKMADVSDLGDCGSAYADCQNLTSSEPLISLRSLEPYTLYQTQVSMSNYYTQLQGKPVVPGPIATHRTKEGTPSPPRDIRATTESPTEANITWKSPKFPHGRLESILYVIKWHTFNGNGIKTEGRVVVKDYTRVVLFVDSDGATYSCLVNDLQEAHTYFFKILAYDVNEVGYSESAEVSNTTYQYPGPIDHIGESKTSLSVQWQSPSDHSMMRHRIEYAEVKEGVPFSELDWIHHSDLEFLLPYITQNATLYNETIEDLKPNTKYAFRINLVYKSMKHFIWPIRLKHVYSTSPDVPQQPSAPTVRHGNDGVEVVEWDEPNDGGSPIKFYELCFRPAQENNWTQVSNLTETIWTFTDLTLGENYIFKVRAQNQIGWSPYSDNSTVYMNLKAGPTGDKLTLILGISITVILVLVIIAVIILTVGCRRYKDHKQIPFNLVNGIRQSPDMELATLRELPRVTVQQANALYAINVPAGTISNKAIDVIIPTDEDIAALPHFCRAQLTLTKFLGSGAFGEVFEGLAKNILGENSGETKCAVKTLRKGATDQEKEEFLKEALLMSNFKHEHILGLLGVCLDNDPQFIILELMEGGDLLSYLRASRPTPTQDAKLILPDMVGISVDVAKGCKYLEDMHFVHRDLAARNCLVSSKEPGRGVVKIGDFGLARDIYKNDYYRKEGEGLLPVRWMSPESLIDGVFTTQSDVWAFGVMMWEVLTLGQQPYPARTNLEVLHFVRSGGRLDRPDNCPDDLYHLMLKCWCFSSDDRPTFRYLLNQLESFKRRSQDPNDEFSGKNINLRGYAKSDSECAYSDINIGWGKKNNTGNGTLNYIHIGHGLVDPSDTDWFTEDLDQEQERTKPESHISERFPLGGRKAVPEMPVKTRKKPAKVTDKLLHSGHKPLSPIVEVPEQLCYVRVESVSSNRSDKSCNSQYSSVTSESGNDCRESGGDSRESEGDNRESEGDSRESEGDNRESGGDSRESKGDGRESGSDSRGREGDIWETEAHYRKSSDDNRNGETRNTNSEKQSVGKLDSPIVANMNGSLPCKLELSGSPKGVSPSSKGVVVSPEGVVVSLPDTAPCKVPPEQVDISSYIKRSEQETVTSTRL